MKHRAPMRHEIYLDNNATTRPFAEVQEALLEALGDGFGNPSSIHSAGERAREHLHQARKSTAAFIGSQPEQIVFTSGGTEANNLVLLSLLDSSQRSGTLVTTEVEHSSVLRCADLLESRGVQVVYLPVGRSGLVDLEHLNAALGSGASLVSVQWANNETGVIQPMARIAQMCQEHNVLLHTDAAQAVGKVPIDLGSMPIDYLSLTGHKLHAPLGVGALYCREPRKMPRPRLSVGAQEMGIRPGTENVPGIVGLGVAMSLRHERFGEATEKMKLLRDTFEREILDNLPEVQINGTTGDRTVNTTNLRFTGIDGQALTVRLDQLGIRCSQSSACTNQRPEPSYVLQAMGLSETEAYESIRFSVSEETTREEIDKAVKAVIDLHESLSDLLLGRISATHGRRRKASAKMEPSGAEHKPPASPDPS